MPSPNTPEQQTLLQTVWDLTTQAGRWPMFAEVDRRLDQLHGLEVVTLAASLQPGLLLQQNLQYARDDWPLQLSIAAVATCAGTAEVVELFLWGIALATERERVTEVGATAPELKAADLAAAHPATGDLIGQVGLILGAEPWGWSVYSAGPAEGPVAWSFTLTRRVRALRDATDLNTYWNATHPEQEPRADRTAHSIRTPFNAALALTGRAINHPWATTVLGGVIVVLGAAWLTRWLHLA